MRGARAGNFDIPARPDQSTAGARRVYEKTFGRTWPHDDAYLRQLARETPSANDCLAMETTRCKFLLLRMRENDSP